jgi:FtsZ-binding cell division protein ZapB
MHTPGSVARALVYALVMADASTSLPESTPASPVPDSVSEASPPKDSPNESETEPPLAADIPEAHRDVVERLYRTVQAAVATIDELRAENERLRERIEELEAEPEYPDDETILALDDNPEAVREQITQFINTIDTYLNTPASAPPEAAAEDPDS